MKKFGKKERVLSGILVAALVVLALAVGVKSYQRNHTKVEAKTPSAKNTEVEKSELTFDFDTYEYAKAYPELSREFCDNSMPNKAAERVAAAGFSDALSTPFSVTHGTKDGEKYSEDEVSIMGNEFRQEVLASTPVTQSLLAAFENVALSDGTRLTQINPWIIKSRSEYLRFMEEGTGNQNYLREEGGKLYINDRQLKDGVAALWLYDRLINQGVQLVTTNHHYPLSLANTDSAKLTTFTEAHYEFTRDAMVLAYVNKAGTEVFKIGINVHDKRPELIVTKKVPKEKTKSKPKPKKPIPKPKPKKPIPKPKPQPNTEPGDKPIPNPQPGHGGGEKPKEPQPETKKDFVKDPAKDPVNNGGAKIGGGNTTVGTDVFEPTDPAVRTDGGHEKPANVKPATPAPDAAHKDVGTVKTDENKVSYETHESQKTQWEYKEKEGEASKKVEYDGNKTEDANKNGDEMSAPE